MIVHNSSTVILCRDFVLRLLELILYISIIQESHLSLHWIFQYSLIIQQRVWVHFSLGPTSPGHLVPPSHGFCWLCRSLYWPPLSSWDMTGSCLPLSLEPAVHSQARLPHPLWPQPDPPQSCLPGHPLSPLSATVSLPSWPPSPAAGVSCVDLTLSASLPRTRTQGLQGRGPSPSLLVPRALLGT